MTMKAFNETIGLWVIGRGGATRNAQKRVHLLPRRARKLGTSVHREVGWHSEAGHPGAKERVAAGRGFDVGQWLHFRPASETVDDC